jgi:soluble lytic murein transglycosylase-like protein
LKKLKKLGAVLVLMGTPLMLKAADVAMLRNGFEIRHEQREAHGDMTRLYLNSDRSGGYVDVRSEEIISFEHDESIREPNQSAQVTQSPSRSASPLQPRPVDVHAVVSSVGAAHALDPDFIASVIGAESSFNPRAISNKGAQGLMQLMPQTALQLGVTDSFDIRANVDGGTRYLRELLLRYNDDVAKALAAYNAGPHRVDRYGGVPPYAETRHYVARIIRDYNRKKAAKKHAVQKPGSKKTVKVAGANATEGTSAGGS